MCPKNMIMGIQPGTSWQWQLASPPSPLSLLDVGVYDIDLFDTPQSTIDQLHAAGTAVICYFSAGTWENWRPDASKFPSNVLGNDVSGWPGEKWLDTRSTVVRSLMAARLDLAVNKSCDGVEPDNVDGYQNTPGFPLTAATQLDYNQYIAKQAHARFLSVALKNDLSQITQLVSSFDWALCEQCNQYSECNMLKPFISQNKAVFSAEYQNKTSTYCPIENNLNFDALYKNLNLDAFRVACRTYPTPKGNPVRCYSPQTDESGPFYDY